MVVSQMENCFLSLEIGHGHEGGHGLWNTNVNSDKVYDSIIMYDII